MPLTYLDSSALVKRYIPEAGSAWIRRLCDAEPVAISLISVPEIASALARRTREGVLTAQQRDTLFRLFLSNVQSFVVVDVNQTIAQRAATMLLTVPVPLRLRALDALHVTSAQWAFARARRRGIATGNFVTADHALVDAAAWAGLPAVNPEDYP
jgi:predicted nucleic acid-binding protein